MEELEDAFQLLETATKLEKSGNQRIEAATKYYEAVYLMKQVLQHTPHTQQNEAIHALLEEKIEFYSAQASRLYFDDSSTIAGGETISTITTVDNDPRSPFNVGQKKHFFSNNNKNESSLSRSSRNNSSSNSNITSMVVNRKAHDATSKLSSAIQLDEQGKSKEALKEYLKAAEAYLEVIRLSGKTSDSVTSNSWTKRLEGVLDRVEQLKNPTPAAVGSSNHSIQTSGRTKDAKSVATTTRPAASSYSKEEIEVLKRSSLISSGVFLPWSEEEAQQLSNRVVNNNMKSSSISSPYTDPKGDLTLSDKQRKKFYKWARPSEIVKMRQQYGHKQHPPTMIRDVNPYSIRQQYVTDCSFIASLVICAAFEKRFRKPLIRSIIYPQNNHGEPIYNPEGKYMVKLWLNGVTRQVIVDDKLPIDRNSNLLCSDTSSATQNNQLELWVTIIEKA